MSFGKDSSPPAQPNPALAIAAQSAANREAIRESARISSIDQFTPTGSVTFTRDDEGIPTSQIVSATPAGQEFIDTTQALGNTLANAATTQAGFLPTESFNLDGVSQAGAGSLDLSTLPGNTTAGLPGFTGVTANAQVNAPGATTTGAGPTFDQGPVIGGIKGPGGSQRVEGPNQTTSTSFKDRGVGPTTDSRGPNIADQDQNRIEQAVFNRELSLLQPQFDRARERLNQDLANRGIPIGSEAHSDALRQLDDAQGAQLGRLADTATITGSQEAGRLFSQALQGQQLGLGREQQAFGQQVSGQQDLTARQAQDFGQQQARSAFGLGQEGQRFQERLGQTGVRQQQQAFNLAQQQQRFGNEIAAEQFGQGREAQAFQQLLANAQFGLGEGSQRFGQELAASQLDLAGRGQQFAERLQGRQQGISEQGANIQLANAQRQRQIQEQQLVRTQPFNELAAFLQGAPALATPGLQQTPAFNVAPPDIIGAQNAFAKNNLQAAKNQQALNSANLNGLFTLGGTLGAAAIRR